MTVIVKPRMPETSDDLITDYLTDLLGTLSFPSFEAAEAGEITLLGTRFYMRIGKFLGQPSQAIIAEKQFVKMRHVTEYDKNDLKVLEVSDPDCCLYDNGHWCPPFRQPAMPAGLGGIMQGMPLQQGIQGIAQANNPYWQNQFGNQNTAVQQKAYMDMLQAQAQINKYAPPQIYGTFEDDSNDTRSWWQRVMGV